MLSLASACQLQQLEADLVDASELGTLAGRVDVDAWDGAPIHVFVFQKPEAPGLPIRVIRRRTLDRPGLWAFQVEPGSYFVGAFVDAQRNERLDPEETAAFTEEALVIAKGEDRLDITLHARGPVDRDAITEGRDVVMDLTVRAGDVLTLDDPRFSEEAGAEGLWQPRRSLERFPPGLYLLEPYDAAKTPVLFIHGMAGYAQEFRHLIERLDRTRFQPWVFQYPSAHPLRGVASVLDDSVRQMVARHAPERLCVVAHSMGGLLGRRLLRWRADDSPPLVRGFVTIASPLGGMRSAQSGVDMAPVVVPAWRDLVPDGPFLRQRYDRPLPTGTEYHLLFTYQDEGANDGTVALESQLRVEAQDEATVVRGYEASHVGALSDPDVAAQVAVALDRCRGDRPDAPRVAPRSARGAAADAPTP